MHFYTLLLLTLLCGNQSNALSNAFSELALLMVKLCLEPFEPRWYLGLPSFTKGSAVAQRRWDDLFLSVVSFHIPPEQFFFIKSYLASDLAMRTIILHSVLLSSVVSGVCSHWTMTKCLWQARWHRVCPPLRRRLARTTKHGRRGATVHHFTLGGSYGWQQHTYNDVFLVWSHAVTVSKSQSVLY